MHLGSKQAAVALLAGTVGFLWSSGALGSEGTLPARTALAQINGDGAFLFTTRFCEPGTCMDGIVGVTKSGRAALPVLVAAPGETIGFKVAFAPSSLRLTVRAPGVETTTSLAGATWQVPDDLPLPASLQLDATNETHSGTFVAILDRTAPGPSLDRASVRRPRTQRRPVFDIWFRLCSPQTGAVQIHLAEKRAVGTRSIERVLLSTHTPGCRSYRVQQLSPWSRPGVSGRLVLQAKVGRSQLSLPRSLSPAAKSAGEP